VEVEEEHLCGGNRQGNIIEQQPKQQPQQSQQQTVPRNELADIQDEINEIRALLKTAITQVQLAREEIRELKRMQKQLEELKQKQ